MSLANEKTKKVYTGNGSTTVFPYDFKVFNKAHLRVLVGSTEQTVDVDYTVSGVGEAAGGNVIFTTAPADESGVVIMRNMDAIQETEYTASGAFPASAHEAAIDRLTMMVQQLKEQVDRMPLLPVETYEGGDLDPLELATGNGRAIGWTADGKELKTYPVTTISSAVLDDIGNYSDDLATAVSEIGATRTTLVIDKDISTTTDISTPKTLRLMPINDAKINILVTKTLLVYSPEHIIISKGQQLHGNVITGGDLKFFIGGTVTTELFGAQGDNSNDDQPPAQAAFDSIPRGTVELLGDRRYKMASAIVWPAVNATILREIVFRGQSESSSVSGISSVIPGNTAINYTGSGTFLDLRSGDGSNMEFLGTVKNMNIYGPGTGGSTIGIDAYKVSRATFENVIIQYFDTGFELNYHAYYAVFHRLWCRNNGVGFEQKAGVINKSPFVECMFSENDNEGFLRNNVQSSDNLVFDGCYGEGNGGSGLKITGYFRSVLVMSSHFENNGDSNIYVSSDPFINTTVSVIDSTFGGNYYAVEVLEVASLILEGNTFNSYDSVGGYVIKAETWTKITDISNNNLTPVPLVLSSRDVSSVGSPMDPGWSSHWRLPLYRQRNHDGDMISDSSAKVPGDTTHYVVGVPGAGSSVIDLAGYTGTTTGASAVVAITAGTVAGLIPGSYIKIATETFGSGDTYAQILKVDPAAVAITLDKTADNGVTAQAITYQYADIFHQGVTGLLSKKETTADDAAFYTADLTATDYVETGVAYVIVEGKTQYSGVVMFLVAAGGAETVLIGGGADFEVATGALAGSTGSDAKVTLSAHTDGKLYVENRSGATQTISLKIVDGR